MPRDERDLEARFEELSKRNAHLMTLLEAKLEPAPAPAPAGISADQLESILMRSTANASKTSELIASKIKPENVDHLHKGPFEHPQGGIAMPKPALKREGLFAGRWMRLEELTWVEAVAFNALSDTLTRGQRRLARDGKWIAKVTDDDTKLLLSVPMKSIDDRAELPSFLEICQELTSGTRAPDQAELAAEMALLKQQMATLVLGVTG